MHLMDHACHTFEENKASHHWKHLFLELPTGHAVMSGKDIYEESGDDEEHKLDIIPIVYSHATLGSSINTVHYADQSLEGWEKRLEQCYKKRQD